MYLGKEYIEQQINEMDCTIVNTLLNRYESVLSAQMTKSLGKSVINLYSNIACSALGVGNQQNLSDDLCDLYYRFGALLAPASIAIITGKHYAKNSVTKLNGRSNSGTVTQQNQETVTKQKNPLRIEQGRKLVEYNRCKKEELKRLNEQITKQDDIAEHRPKPNTNTYVYAGGLSMLGLAIGGYLLYSKFKKPERKLIDVPAPPVAKTNTEPKRDIFEML